MCIIYKYHSALCFVFSVIPTWVNEDHMNSLHFAAIGGHLEIVKCLMPKFGDSKFDVDNLVQRCLH